MQNLLNKYVLIDIFRVKKRVFYTFSVIFQLSCPCNITAPVFSRRFSKKITDYTSGFFETGQLTDFYKQFYQHLFN